MIDFGLTPGLLYRGPMPNSQEEVAQLKFIYGIHTIINLQASNQNESQWWCYREGVLQLEVGCFPLAPPTRRTVDRVLYMLGDRNLTPIYLHCRAGVDRTGFIVANYRIRVCGKSQAEAVAEMYAAGMHPWYRWWSYFL